MTFILKYYVCKMSIKFREIRNGKVSLGRDEF